jgi:hypothetical protein
MSSCYKLVNLLRYKQFNHRLALYEFENPYLMKYHKNNDKLLILDNFKHDYKIKHLNDFDFLFNINTNNPQKLREVWDAHFEYILLKYKYGSDETIYILPSQRSSTMYKFSHPIKLQNTIIFN